MASADEGHVPRPIVLVGFMASGKSKIGRLLAKRLEIPFVDSDAVIGQEFGRSIPEIFRAEGEAAFRAAERRIIANLISEGAKVIATGGGAFVDSHSRTRLKQSARTVWLDPPFEVIAARLARSATRPLANDRSEDDLRQLWRERREFYAQADVRVRTANGHPDHAVDAILTALSTL